MPIESDPGASDRSLTSLDELDVVFDADGHVEETGELLVPYIDERHTGVKHILEQAASSEFGGISRTIYSATHSLPAFMEHGIYNDEPTRDAETKLRHMDEFGLDYSMLDPTMNLGLPTVNNSRCAVALAQAYNSWLIDQFLDESDRLFGSILAAPQLPEIAAEEIDDRADEDGMVAVQLPASGLLPPPGHQWYDPIYEAAEDNDLPVLMHSGSAGAATLMPTMQKWNETYAEEHFIVHPVSHMWNLVTMFFQGVPERFPDLEFVFQEAGIGWIPYSIWRLDDHYLECPDEAPLLNRLPSSYIEEQFYFTTQPLGHTARANKHLAWAIEMIGADSIMYASDLDHPDFDPPEELFDRVKGHFDDDTVRGMMGETAAELFDLT